MVNFTNKMLIKMASMNISLTSKRVVLIVSLIVVVDCVVHFLQKLNPRHLEKFLSCQ